MLLVTSMLLYFYFLLELIKRKFKIRTLYTRKIAHVLSGIAVVIFSLYLTKIEYLIITAIFILLFAIVYKNKLLNSINMDNTIGEVLYPISMFILGAFLYGQIALFISGVLILALADTASAIFGRKYSDSPNLFHGAIAFFVATYILLFPVEIFLIRIAMSVILSYTEYISDGGWDNLTVPVVYTILVLTF